MTQSIAGRLHWFLLGPLLALLLVSGVAADAKLRRILVDFVDQGLLTQANALATMTEIEDDKVVFEFDEAGGLAAFERQTLGMIFQVSRSSGEIVRARTGAGGDLPETGALHESPIYRDHVLSNGDSVRTVEIQFVPRHERDGQPVTVPSTEASRITLVVARKTEDILGLLAKLRVALIALFGFILLAGSGLILLGTKRGLQPLAAVSSEVDNIDARNLHFRFSPGVVPREIRPLCEKLNELLKRLTTSFESEMRFTDDAAHELRTPVAELRALAEVALASSDTLDPETREAFADALDIAIHLGNVTQQLYDLARCNSGNAALKNEAVDLVKELKTLWKAETNKAAGKNIRVEMNLPPTLMCRANPHAVQSILRNLISNAVEYTPEGRSIDIVVSGTAHEFEVVVSNPAPDLNLDDVAHIFDRFWRKDEARSPSEHSGLGLSVAQSFAVSLGWKLHAQLFDGGLIMVLQGNKAKRFDQTKNVGADKDLVCVEPMPASVP